MTEKSMTAKFYHKLLLSWIFDFFVIIGSNFSWLFIWCINNCTCHGFWNSILPWLDMIGWNRLEDFRFQLMVIIVPSISSIASPFFIIFTWETRETK